MNMDNFNINKYNFFWNCVYSFYSRHTFASQIIVLPFLLGINLFLKFTIVQLNILHPHGFHHFTCLSEHRITQPASVTLSKHKLAPRVYSSPAQPSLLMTDVVLRHWLCHGLCQGRPLISTNSGLNLQTELSLTRCAIRFRGYFWSPLCFTSLVS